MSSAGLAREPSVFFPSKFSGIGTEKSIAFSLRSWKCHRHCIFERRYLSSALQQVPYPLLCQSSSCWNGREEEELIRSALLGWGIRSTWWKGHFWNMFPGISSLLSSLFTVTLISLESLSTPGELTRAGLCAAERGAGTLLGCSGCRRGPAQRLSLLCQGLAPRGCGGAFLLLNVERGHQPARLREVLSLAVLRGHRVLVLCLQYDREPLSWRELYQG